MVKKNTYHDMMYDLGRTLAVVNNAPWEKVKLLYSYCPQMVDNQFIIYPYSLDCIIALGTYYIQSKFCHSEKIIPYLLNLLKGLTTSKWVFNDEKSDVPPAEKFSFCLNTLVSEISVTEEKDIFSYQVNEIANVSRYIIKDLKNGFRNSDEVKIFFSVKLPVFLGLAQSMARYKKQKTSFFCYLFPKHKAHVGIVHNIKAKYALPHINLVSPICEQGEIFNLKSCNHNFTREHCQHPTESIIGVITIVHSLLSDQMLKKFEQILKSQENTSYFYSGNVSEVVKCAAMILYRDVLYQQNSLKDVNNIRVFIDHIYSSVPIEDSVNHPHVKLSNNEEVSYLQLKINVLTKVTCLELLLSTAKGPYEAESLCAHLTSLLKYKPNKSKILTFTAPFTIGCISVLGSLAEKFPYVSDACVVALQNFLSSPSSILVNLCNKSYLSSENSTFMKHNKPILEAFEYSIFKKVQKSAIENLCKSLISLSSIDSNYIPGFLTKFSSLLFMEKNHPQYALIIENVVISLGHISYSIPQFSLTILQCFQQRLCRHSIESDIAIIYQLGNMLITHTNKDVFMGTLKTFSNIVSEINVDSKKELEHISNSLFPVLSNVAERLYETSKINATFIRFLEIFVQTGLDQLRNTEIDQVNQSTKSCQENLLSVIALLAKKLKEESPLKKQHERTYQDFWLFFIISKESVMLECNCDTYLKIIAPKLPVLTSESFTDHDLREFFYTSSLSKIKISMIKQNALRTQMNNFMKNTSDVAFIVNKLTLPQLIYLFSVCSSETIRIKSSEEPTIKSFFYYLTNSKLQKDKYGMWQCICKVAEGIFESFLDTMSSKKRDDIRERVLEANACMLLIYFNNIHSQVRHIADKYFSELIEMFPHLLWNRKVLWSMVDIISVLNYSLLIDPNEQIVSLVVPHSGFSIYLTDTQKSREEIFSDFVARSREIVSEAKKWALAVVNSHLQEYIVREENKFLNHESIHQQRHCAWTLLCSNNESYLEIGNTTSSLTNRSKFLGEVTGLIEKSNLSPADFGKSLADEVWKACFIKDERYYQNSLQRATAFAVSQVTFQAEIKKVLSSSYVQLFTENTVRTAIHCWYWLFSVHPEFELEFLTEMFEAWRYTVDNRLGLFSEPKFNDMREVKSKSDFSHPHTPWVEFIVLQISFSKYYCQDKLEMIISFLHDTLPISIGGSDCVMLRSVDNIVARFSILSSALSLLQYDISVPLLNRAIVRQRVYCSCLDFFCCLRRFPGKNGLHLEQNIDVLMKFWQTLYSDKKYILKYSTADESQNSSENSQSIKEKQNNSPPLNFKSFNYLPSNNSFSNDFIMKRKLALLLIAEEIEFLSTWSDPYPRSSINKIREWQAKFYSADKYMHDFIKSAWNISPILTMYLPRRLKHDDRISNEVSKVILTNPAVVSHIPHAMISLVTVENLQKDCKELVHITTWATADKIDMMNLLSRNFPSNPLVLQYVTNGLLSCDIDSLIDYIPQLVQCLRYDSLGYVVNLLRKLAEKSQLFFHQMIWNMKANICSDPNMQVHITFNEQLTELVNNMVSTLTGPQKIFYEREFEFIDQITDVSFKIPRNLKKEEKRSACLQALKDVQVKPGCYLPSSPDALVIDLDYNSGYPLQSKARTPYLANFLVCRCSFDKVHEIGIEVSKKQMSGVSFENLELDEAHWGPKTWQPTIFKAADDVRQDILALQTIRYLMKLFKGIGLNVYLYPYNVIAVAFNMGVIECIPNAYSRDQLGKQTNVGLYDYFISTFGDETSAKFQEAQQNFVKSVAAYSLVSFLLQIKDRHNGNIMIDDDGHVIHIDFGFMFESSPGGNLGFEPDMKLTEEMLMIMGGRVDAEPFKMFVKHCVKAYLATRYYREHIVTLVTLMLDSGLPCFRGQTIKLLQGRFAPNASESEAASYIMTVIRNSCLNFRTVTYDMLQYLQNSIQY